MLCRHSGDPMNVDPFFDASPSGTVVYAYKKPIGQITDSGTITNSQDNTNSTVFDMACWHVSHGISVFRLPYGQKADPKFKWIEYTERLPTDQELESWFANGDMNYAVIGGKVSGDLVIFDLDDPNLLPLIFNTTVDHIRKKKLTRLVKSKKGFHLYFRDKNHKGMKSKNLRNSKTPFINFEIDIKAEHGYVVGPGSLHPEGVTYETLCDVEPKSVDLGKMIDQLVLPNMGYLVLSRIIDPIYVKGIRYELTLALGTYLYSQMSWSMDTLKEFFDFHDRYLALKGEDKHRNATLTWLYNKLASMDRHDLIVGKALDDDTIKQIKKYEPFINGKGIIDHQAPPEDDHKKPTDRMEYWFDDANGVSFIDGNLYKLTKSERGTTDKFMLHVQMELRGVVNFDNEIKIRYKLESENEERLESVRETVSHIPAQSL